LGSIFTGGVVVLHTLGLASKSVEPATLNWLAYVTAVSLPLAEPTRARSSLRSLVQVPHTPVMRGMVLSVVTLSIKPKSLPGVFR